MDGPAPAARSRKTWLRVAIVCASTILWLGAGELLVRRFAPIDELVFELDPRRLYRPLPGARTLEVPPAGSRATPVLWQFNAHGLRGPELAARDPRTKRVLVLGDSFVHARETPLADTFVVRLAEAMRRNGQAVETLNAGVAGYGPDQSLLRFEQEVDALAPDVVVLALCAHNDLDDPLRNGIFALSESGELVERAPGIDARYAERQERKRAIAARPMLARWLSHLLASTEADDRLGGAQRDAWRVASRAYAALVAGAPDTSMDANARDALVVARAKVALLEQLLARFRSGCSARNIAFAIVVIPSSYDIVDPDPPGPESDGVGGAIDRAIDAVARKLGIPCLDLYDAFWEHADEPLYLGASEIHWSARGQALAAELTAEFLAETERP